MILKNYIILIATDARIKIILVAKNYESKMVIHSKSLYFPPYDQHSVVKILRTFEYADFSSKISGTLHPALSLFGKQ